MTSHELTASAYVVIGLVLLIESMALLLRDPRDAVRDFLTWVSQFPVAGTVWVVVSNLWLFGLFIFACALDHFTHGHVRFFADFETVVSLFTAAVVFSEWVYLKWVR